MRWTGQRHGDRDPGLGVETEVPPLAIEFLDSLIEVDPSDTLGFGRSSDIVIDEGNPFLHRVTGVIACRSGVWWLDNVGSRIALVAISGDGSRKEIAPGASVAIAPGATRVVFEAGRARYEFTCRMGDADYYRPESSSVRAGSTTSEWGMAPLNFEQRQLLAALVEPRIRSGSEVVPSNKEMADRLGWSTKKLERKLDYLCQRYAEAGVTGLRGSLGSDAGRRRARLAEHVVRLRIVGTEDLDLLDLTAPQ